jgi:hypothetical protein
MKFEYCTDLESEFLNEFCTTLDVPAFMIPTSRKHVMSYFELNTTEPQKILDWVTSNFKPKEK